MFVIRSLRNATLLGMAGVIVAEVVVPVVARYLATRRALLEDAKDDLVVLNSHAVFKTSLTEFPSTIPMSTRKGLAPTKDEKVKLLRNNHKRFCGKWARAAKVRFSYAQECQDTALNRASLQRWLLSQWKGLKNSAGDGMELHVMDLFMRDTVDMSFLPTDEVAQSVSKVSIRKRARMERYNERKFVEGWK